MGNCQGMRRGGNGSREEQGFGENELKPLRGNGSKKAESWELGTVGRERYQSQ